MAYKEETLDTFKRKLFMFLENSRVDKYGNTQPAKPLRLDERAVEHLRSFYDYIDRETRCSEAGIRIRDWCVRASPPGSQARRNFPSMRK